jgi:hypothetical protein
MRLFLYASLAEVEMAPNYIASIIKHLLDTVMQEALHETGLKTPNDQAQVQEICWILHGAVSHLAIRRHIYHDQTPLAVEKVIALQIGSFLAGLRSILPSNSASSIE